MTSQPKVKWGVLSTAKIGVEKVIPAMQKCDNLEIHAIASRNEAQATAVARQLNIAKAYGSYEELLDDPDVEAVYIPLPNHMHFEWAAKAIKKGKHVLCEKPLTLSSQEIQQLIRLRDQHQVKVGEAFMVHTHPQWVKARQLVQAGAIGQVTAVQGFFSYFKTDPGNIRNILDFGGGAMWDIGCYPIHASRMVLGREPTRALALVERDPVMKVDRKASVVLDYQDVQCTFTVGTQTVAYQRMTFFGTEKKLEVEIPFNAPNDRKCRMFTQDGSLFGEHKETIEFDICDQYSIQGEIFSKAILEDTDVPVSLEDALANCKVIEAVFTSEKQGGWISL